MSNTYDAGKHAQIALALFERTGMIQEVLSLHPLPYYSSHVASVWQCVFEKHPEAIKEIELKSVYAQFLHWQGKVKSQKNKPVLAGAVATLAVTFLSNKVESPNYGLTLEELAMVIRDCLQDETFDTAMPQEAEWNLQNRIEIDTKYTAEFRNPKWVDEARTIKDIVGKFFGNGARK